MIWVLHDIEVMNEINQNAEIDNIDKVDEFDIIV